MILPGHCFIIKSQCVLRPLRGSWSSPWSAAAAFTDRYATALYFFDVGATAAVQSEPFVHRGTAGSVAGRLLQYSALVDCT